VIIVYILIQTVTHRAGRSPARKAVTAAAPCGDEVRERTRFRSRRQAGKRAGPMRTHAKGGRARGIRDKGDKRHKNKESINYEIRDSYRDSR